MAVKDLYNTQVVEHTAPYDTLYFIITSTQTIITETVLH